MASFKKNLQICQNWQTFKTETLALAQPREVVMGMLDNQGPSRAKQPVHRLCGWWSGMMPLAW